RLRDCGDALLGLEGVFSGSLSWLFNQYDGSRPFSELLYEARRLGYTEPDPRLDLSGEDVARKLLILARTAGLTLERDSIQVENLVPTSLRTLDSASFLAQAKQLDVPLAQRQARVQAHGAVLRYLARFDEQHRARVGLVEVPASHPAAHLQGSDNLFIVRTRRYALQPLVIQGPGAGPEVTAQALLGDVLALS
ncbi:MAG TPA: homoserine dehydrogenase, partial [Mizugakiibacter sp.]|nr:homoserine dehydrogenase [Mizugakiibacter sp.]